MDSKPSNILTFVFTFFNVLEPGADDDDAADDEAADDEARDAEARCHFEALFHDTLPHPGFP